MIYFSLPGYYVNYRTNLQILTIQKLKPHYFYDNIIIDSVYDCLPNIIWNGGRILNEDKTLKSSGQDIYHLRDSFYNLGVSLRHTYTNSNLTKEMLLDYKANQWTKACEKEGNAVIVSDVFMADYIKKNYPLYNIIWSTTTCLKDLNKINEITSKEMLVLDYSYNSNEEILNSLKHPENIEVLCAEYCIDNCPHRKKHYCQVSKIAINEEGTEDFSCPYYKGQQNFYQYLKTSKHILTNKQVFEYNQKYNISHFKINGRSLNWIAYIEVLVYYLIKDEYKDYVRQLLLLNY